MFVSRKSLCSPPVHLQQLPNLPRHRWDVGSQAIRMGEGPAVETLQLPPALAVDDVPHIDKGAGFLGTRE